MSKAPNPPGTADAAPKRIGRPPAKAGEGKTEAVLLKLTPAQRDKLRALGGAGWMRSKIDAEKL